VKDYVLDPDPQAQHVRHFKMMGADSYTLTIQNFPQNEVNRRWGVRPFNSPALPWTWRPSRGDAIQLAREMSVPRETEV
jgi:hypothetical protein